VDKISEAGEKVTKQEAKSTCIPHVVQILKLMLRLKQIRLTWACGRASGGGSCAKHLHAGEERGHVSAAGDYARSCTVWERVCWTLTRAAEGVMQRTERGGWRWYVSSGQRFWARQGCIEKGRRRASARLGKRASIVRWELYRSYPGRRRVHSHLHVHRQSPSLPSISVASTASPPGHQPPPRSCTPTHPAPAAMSDAAVDPSLSDDEVNDLATPAEHEEVEAPRATVEGNGLDDEDEDDLFGDGDDADADAPM
jgi:hypothetical protein